jgi:LysM repeat protein
MKGRRLLLLAVGVAAIVVLLTGCHLPAAPDVTPTPSGDEMDAGMALLGTSAALTAEVQSSLPTPTLEPTSQPTPVATTSPTSQPTATPTQPTGEQPTATPTGAPAGTETTYVIQPGDTLFRIARRYGMRFEDLARYNGIVNPHRINVGQVIRIPVEGVSLSTPPAQGEIFYTVQPGDNLYRISLRYNLNYMYLASYNGIANPHRISVGQAIRIPVTQ